MKRTLLTTAILLGISGSAMAANDGLVIENSVHPEHTVWIQKIADGTHTYELRMENGEITVVVDGDQVPENRIKKEQNAVVILKDDGGVLYEFELAFAVDAKHTGHIGHVGQDQKRIAFVTRSGGEGTVEFIGDLDNGGMLTGTVMAPKVMLGIYSDEPSESIRKQLGIKGKAIIVESVIKGLSADKAGMKDHDIIISIDGSDGVSPNELTKILRKYTPGDKINIVVIRNGEKLNLGTKLHAYNAKVLGHIQRENGQQWSNIHGSFPENIQSTTGVRKFFSSETQKKTHESILNALRDQGMSKKKIAEIEAKIMASLDENVWSAFGQDAARIFEFRTDELGKDQEEINRSVLHRSVLPGKMRKKAEQAMHDAERMTMEFKDGQLLLKRHTEGLEGRLLELTERLGESVPVMEAELENRLGELEGRLGELEDMLDSKMETMTDLIERLIDRLEEE